MDRPRRHLFLLRELVKRDFRGRYAGSLLSFLWSFVQPLFMLGLFTFVFGTILELKLEMMGADRRMAGTDSFGIFLFCGLLPWTAVQEGVQRSATAITDNATLVKKLQFPTEILILSVVIGALLHQAIAAGVFVVILAAVGELAWASLPWLLLVVPLQAGLTLGLGLLLASAQVFFRDTSQVVGMALMGWFYLTPIVYPLEMVPDGLRGLVEANPLTPVVELYRTALLGARFRLVPEAIGLAVAAAVLAAVGVWLFRKLRPAFVDEI